MEDNLFLKGMDCCRICGGREFTLAVEIPYLRMPGMCRFLACQRCGTVIDTGTFRPEYASGSNAQYEWADIRFYVEYAASLDVMATILFTLDYIRRFNGQAGRPKYLDVGTAFGFPVAMAERLQWEAVGVEPSEFGCYGREILGANIIQTYLDAAGLEENSFDLITILDVLEHVHDPKEFLASLTRLLAPEGYLYLITPNAEAVTGGLEKNLVDVLSPGYHLNILSPQALESLLVENRFAENQMFFEGGETGRTAIRLLASNQPGALPPAIPWEELRTDAQQFVEIYLRELIEMKESQEADDILYRGALFRSCAREMEAGNYTAAEPYLLKLLNLMKKSGWSTTRIGHLEGTNFFDYLEQVPAYSGTFYYYLGLYYLNYTRQYPLAAEAFSNAALLFQIETNTQIYVSAGKRERALYYKGLAQYRSGHLQKARDTFAALTANPQSIPEEFRKDIYQKQGNTYLALLQVHSALASYREVICRPPQRIRHKLLCRIIAAILG